MRYEQFHIILTDPEKYPDDCLAIARADSPFWGRRTGERDPLGNAAMTVTDSSPTGRGSCPW